MQNAQRKAMTDRLVELGKQYDREPDHKRRQRIAQQMQAAVDFYD